jgi:enoyl-CoA hydratase/carnithine racemase
MSRDIATEVADDGVATLTMARPERRNALSIKLRDEITEQLDSWAKDPAVRAVVLTGAGSTFCAGFDLDEFAQADLGSSIRDSSRRYHLAVWHFPKPLVAAINGPAVAGGMDLCVLCDFRIASADAVFGHPEIKFGAPPLFTPLQWIVGVGVARELCLTGRRARAAGKCPRGNVSPVRKATAANFGVRHQRRLRRRSVRVASRRADRRHRRQGGQARGGCARGMVGGRTPAPDRAAHAEGVAARHPRGVESAALP